MENEFQERKTLALEVCTTTNETDPKVPLCKALENDGCNPANTLDSLRQLLKRYVPEGRKAASELS